MSVSQNGYKFGDYSLIATYTVVRDVKLSLRKGDASVVLLHLARWFDKNIEPLKAKECGGYNPRTIEGSKTKSNHGSGTAEDLNWNSHARGKKNTFTAAQQKKIREQLKFYEGVIRWGGDYTSIVDDMHFEINKGPADLARVALKCKAESQPPPKPTTPAKPASLLVDGELGPKTIKRWQQVMGTKVDGKIDDDDSELVRAVQKRLRATVNRNLKVDGKLGPHSIAALQSYLRAPVDGKLGPKTVAQLQRRLNTGKF